MPRTVPIQTSFAGGELSPKLKGRVETELWKKALDRCENFEPLAHGPLLSRGGTKWFADFDDLTSACRLIEFPRQGEVGFLMVMGGGALRIRDGITGKAVPDAGADWLKNPRFTYGWQYWTTQAAFVANGRYFLGPLSPTPGAVYQTTASLDPGTYTLRIRYSTAAGNALVLKVGTSGLGSADVIDLLLPGTTGLSDHTTSESSINLLVANALTVYVQTSNNNLETGNGYNAAVEVVEVALRSEGVGNVEWDDVSSPAMPWSDSQLAEIQVVAEPAKDRVMFFHPEVAPYELLYDSETATWTFSAIDFTFTNELDPDWTSPNFPGVAELYQGRLIVGGIPGKRNTLLGSASGDPYNFERATTNAGDAFSLDISTKGAIRWLHGHRSLLLGTDRGEHVVLAQGGVLTPSDFEVRPQSGFGSAAIQAVAVGDQAMYVSRDRRRLRMLSFNLQENGWQTRDLTFTSEHLTGGLILDMDWLSTGNDQVFAVMRSGEVMAWTFNRPEQVIAPWRVDFGLEDGTDFGKVYALCVLEAGDQDKVWLLVQREGTVCLEEWHVADDADRCLLDSWATVAEEYEEGPPPEIGSPAIVPAGFISGLGRFEGHEVYTIEDGIVQSPQTVTGGMVDCTVGVGYVTVGLYAPRTFTTLPKEGGNPGGTAQGSKQRMVKVSLRLNDSAIPLVNGDRAAADRSPETPMDTVEGRVTTDVTCRVLGWEEKGAITVSQDVPIRTEILAIYGVVSTSEV